MVRKSGGKVWRTLPVINTGVFFNHFVTICLFLFLLFEENPATGQETVYKVFYRVYFKDKGTNNIRNYSPLDLLSQRAVARRNKSGIPVPDYRDLPVYYSYIEQISSLGFILHSKSKWMNTALFKSQALKDIQILAKLPFVNAVKIVRNETGRKSVSDKLQIEVNLVDQPPFDNPIEMLNGLAVHNSGFNGENILIAVLDGGFDNAQAISSLTDLRRRDGIKGTYDFVRNDDYVYGFHNHGTAVLSVLAGNIPGSITGTATGADYWLLRSEDTSTEFPVEEDFWATAAEFADSIGADIISSSLGYFNFDDPLLNYKYSDMDGNSTFVTQAADIAASKGILVVSSAGNERNKEWLRIIAPSDGDSVLAVGAVTWDKMISAFSSAGPASDGRVKPDVVSQGVSVPIQTKTSVVERGNGTSFSCPVISGMCACIMQAVPQAINSDIISSLHFAADRFQKPDSLYGYGIPDITSVISQLQSKYISSSERESFVSPNPFKDVIKVTFRETPGQLGIEIIDMNGRLIIRKNFRDYVSRIYLLDDLWSLSEGIYFIRLHTKGGTSVHKVIKIKR